MGLLLLDTLAAVGFAGGIAGAVAAVAGRGALWPWALLMVGMGALRGLFAMLAVRRGAARAGMIKRAQRRRVVAATLHRQAGTPIDSGLLATQAVDAVEALDGYVARFMPARRAAAIAPMLVLAATACASWVAAVILAGTLLPFVAAMILAGGAAADESRRQFIALHRLSARFADRVRALPVVLAFRAEMRETEAIGAAAEELAERTMRVLRIAFLSSAALEFFAALSVALVAVYCGFSLLGLLPFAAPETLTLARAFFVLALAPEFYAPMRRLAAAYHDKQCADTAADTLMPLVEPVRAVPVVAAAPPELARCDDPLSRLLHARRLGPVLLCRGGRDGGAAGSVGQRQDQRAASAAGSRAAVGGNGRGGRCTAHFAGGAGELGGAASPAGRGHDPREPVAGLHPCG